MSTTPITDRLRQQQPVGQSFVWICEAPDLDLQAVVDGRWPDDRAGDPPTLRDRVLAARILTQRHGG